MLKTLQSFFVFYMLNDPQRNDPFEEISFDYKKSISFNKTTEVTLKCFIIQESSGSHFCQGE